MTASSSCDLGKEWDALGKGWNDRAQASQTGQDKGDFSWFGGNVRPRYGTDSRAMQEWHQAWATEALRVLKPGGHLLAFGGTRTYHRLACAVEDAGFEIRDSVIWLYGSGFPKSLDVSKAMDRAAGAEREVVGLEDRRGAFDGVERESEGHSNEYGSITNKGAVERTAAQHHPACGKIEAWPLEDGSDEWEVVDFSGEGDTLYIGTREECEAQVVGCVPQCSVRWQGWGTALAPSHEPIVVARKPLTGTVASNVLKWGTGGINIDATRVSSGPSPSRMNGCPSSESAPHVERLSEWLQVESPEGKGPIALMLAATQPEADPVLLIRIGGEGGSCAQMAMSPSVTEAIISSNIGSSWSASLADRSNGMSRFTTETATALITDERILSLCRSETTPPTITEDATRPSGCECDALPVVESSSGDGLKWSATQLLIAPAPASAPSGRWPKNCVISHLPECQRVGERRVRNQGGVPDATSEKAVQPAFTSTERTSTVHHFGSDGLETVAEWDCVEGCPVDSIGDVARFFFNAEPWKYSPKASRAERTAGVGANAHPT